MEKLEDIIEAVLFALGRDISFNELSQTLKVDKEKVFAAVNKIKIKYNENCNILLFEDKDSIQLITNKRFYEYISLFVENTKRQNLSPSALETLTIIAYNPKITKAEIEQIRGVNSDYAVGRLLECGLVEEVARLNLPGRPAVYSTTKEFLKNCNIKDVSELPDYDKIRLKDEQLMINDLNED